MNQPGNSLDIEKMYDAWFAGQLTLDANETVALLEAWRRYRYTEVCVAPPAAAIRTEHGALVFHVGPLPLSGYAVTEYCYQTTNDFPEPLRPVLSTARLSHMKTSHHDSLGEAIGVCWNKAVHHYDLWRIPLAMDEFARYLVATGNTLAGRLRPYSNPSEARFLAALHEGTPKNRRAAERIAANNDLFYETDAALRAATTDPSD